MGKILKRRTRRRKLKGNRLSKGLFWAVLLFIFLLIGQVFAYKNQADELQQKADKWKKEAQKKPKVIEKIKIKEKKIYIPRKQAIKEYARKRCKARWGEGHWEYLDRLIGTGESGWNPKAVNPTSGACGIGQALPCSKMIVRCGGTWARAKENWKCQVEWTLDYIAKRKELGNPIIAYQRWLSRSPHWY